MKPYSDFKAEKTGGSREILPKGGYVCEIKSVKEESYKSDSGEFKVLILAIDVCEGEYAGFFKKDFDGNDREDKKWRGTYRINEPRDDGSEQDAWTKRVFNNFIYSVQESNHGYVWDWEEKKLKGKKLGVLFREREWEMNGRTGWSTEAAGSAPAQDIRDGTFKLPKDKPLKNRPAAQTPAETAEDEDDLPF